MGQIHCKTSYFVHDNIRNYKTQGKKMISSGKLAIYMIMKKEIHNRRKWQSGKMLKNIKYCQSRPCTASTAKPAVPPPSSLRKESCVPSRRSADPEATQPHLPSGE